MYLSDITLYASSFAAIATAYIITVISPGPDFAMTMRNSLCFSRKTGIWSALGTTTGMCMHLAYTIFGIGYIAQNAGWVLDAIKIVGGTYLIYIGTKSMRTQMATMESIGTNTQVHQQKKLPPAQAFKMGFLTNALNPMVVLLFMGILSRYVDEHTPSTIQLLYGLMIVTISIIWFSTVALCFSNSKVQGTLHKMGPWLDRVTGGLLALLGSKIVLISAYEIIYPPA